MSEFDLNDADLEAALEPAAKARKPKTVEKVLDPEEDRENWPTIFIDFEDKKPNYEFVGVSGTMKDGRPFTHSMQIQRGVDAKVPPSVVNMLRSTKQTVYHQSPDPMTGRMNMNRSDRAPLPWRLIEKGKYC